MSRAAADDREPETRRARDSWGFTLLELLAVLLMIGLVAGIAIPNLRSLGDRSLESQAEQLATELELARQNAIATGRPHRLVLDLDHGEYWTEWEVSASEELAPEPDAVRRVSLQPPARAERSFEPRPDGSGRPARLDDDVVFTGVELETGFSDRGLLYLPFAQDGSTDAASILLTGGGPELEIELRPLADSVRILDADF